VAENKIEEVECDIKGLIVENERLNNVIVEQHQEYEILKITVRDLEKSTGIIRDLESKLRFYVNENDKLNRILVTRSVSGY
jgi:hypothetical protein